jgi:hypothetical protein
LNVDCELPDKESILVLIRRGSIEYLLFRKSNLQLAQRFYLIDHFRGTLHNHIINMINIYNSALAVARELFLPYQPRLVQIQPVPNAISTDRLIMRTIPDDSIIHADGARTGFNSSDSVGFPFDHGTQTKLASKFVVVQIAVTMALRKFAAGVRVQAWADRAIVTEGVGAAGPAA